MLLEDIATMPFNKKYYTNKKDKSKGKIFDVEFFENSTEFNKTINSRRNVIGQTASKDEYGGEEWTSGVSYQKAVKYLDVGYERGLDKIKESLNKFLSKDVRPTRVRTRNDIIGFVPHVPNAIMGIPENMIRQEISPKKNKIITICYDADVSAYVKSEDVLKYSLRIMKYIMQLELNGFRVRLYALGSFNQTSEKVSTYAYFLKLKSEDQQMDIKRLTFPLCHPAFQRRLGFKWYESFPNAKPFWGYGTPLSKTYKLERITDFIQSFLGENAHYVYYGMDLKKLTLRLKGNAAEMLDSSTQY